MRIPVYNENYRYLNSRGGGRLQGVNAGHNQANESLAMAGRNMQGLGNSLMQASNQVFETDDFVAKAKAENAINEMQKSFMAKQTEMEKLKGENALNVSQDFEKWRNEQIQALQKSLDGNERALAYFNMGADEKYAGQKRWVDSYQAQEQETYLDSTYQATLDTAHDDFLHNINNPELMNEAKKRGFGAIQEYVKRKGLGDDVAKQLYKDWISKNFIQGTQLFIDEGNLGRARVLLNYAKDYLGADEAAKLKKNIDSEQERLNAKFEQQLIGNTSKALFEQYRTDPAGAINSLTGNKNLTAEQQQKIAVNLSSMLSQQAQANELQRKAELDSFTAQTKDFMAGNSKTKEEKFQYIQSLPTNSEKRKIANFEYEKNIRKYVPTAKKEEFISMYQNTPAYSKMSRTELGNLFNDFNAQLDGLQIFDPVERVRWMENQMTQVTIDNTLIDDTMSIYQYYNKVNNDASYSAKKFSIPNEERTEIIKSLKKANLVSGYEKKEKVEELVQQAYREKLQIQDSGYVEFDYGYDQKAKTFYESGNPILN